VTTAARPRRGVDWEAAATAIGETLDDYNALVVVGVDPVATGRVAVAIGRSQAKKRRVAVGDLFAESPPIQALVQSDDPHGIVDSFLYGVSLTKIAQPVPDAGQLFVMPSGTEPPVYEEILPNHRWQRLAAGFREVGALLVLAAPANAPHIEELVAATDGAILVGHGVPAKLPVVRVISSVRETPSKGFEMPVLPPARRWTRKRIGVMAGVVLTVALAGIAGWLAMRPFASSVHRIGPKPDTTQGVAAIAPVVRPDTAVVASGVGDSVTALTPPLVENPEDSALAAGYAIELMAANTQAGAILKLQQDGQKLPAATFSPILDSQGSQWFKVIAGASIERAAAESLLTTLRKQKLLDSTTGTVVRLPFAFLIDADLPAAAIPELIGMNRERGIPAYALRQPNGTSWLLVGAFESVEQSQLYAETLRTSGLRPVLVYRKGRIF
jgi:hypothetical protein